MERFTQLDAIAAPLPVVNVDTDMILPAAFLKTVSRQGLGQALFHTARFDADGRERGDFILNREPWRRSQILISLENFGCGSSREHAPWALLDFGIRCVIAPSFADIFYGNCFKNGMLPIVLPRAQVELLIADAARPDTCRLQVDLQAQTVTRNNGELAPFAIEPQRRMRLLQALDDIGITLRHADEITRFEEAAKIERPWILPIPISS